MRDVYDYNYRGNLNGEGEHPFEALISALQRAVQSRLNQIQYLHPSRSIQARQQDVNSRRHLKPSGLNLISELFHLYTNEKESFERINMWLEEFGISRLDMEWDDGTAIPHTTDKQTGSEVNIQEVGAGTQQILPILVFGFRPEPSSILLIEEPEAHLHPGAQEKLLGIFMEIVEKCSQLFITTHSAALLETIQDKGSELEDTVSIYKVEMDDEGTRAQYLSPGGVIMKNGFLHHEN